MTPSDGVPFPLRASAAPYWSKCHAYPRMHASYPDISDTTVREEGTAFHWAALMTWLGHQVLLGTMAPNKVPISDDMLDAIPGYIDFIRTWGPTARLEFSVSAASIHPQCGGQIDANAVDWVRKRIYVGDAKFGYRPVDPFGNKQCLVYVKGLVDFLGIRDDADWIVEIWIYQPRAYRREGPWQSWKVKLVDLRGEFERLGMAAHNTMSANPTARPGSHCEHCNGRYDCQAFADDVGGALETAGDMVQQDLPPAAVEVELQRIERALDLLNARRTGLEARAEHFLIQGKILKHYGMEPSRGKLVWKEGMESTVIELAEVMGLPLAKPRVPITPTQAKAFLDRIDPTMVGELSERKSGALKLTKIDGAKVAKLFNSTL